MVSAEVWEAESVQTQTLFKLNTILSSHEFVKQAQCNMSAHKANR